jgi:hypothetical protein
MKYILEWTENKVTSTGKRMMKVTLKDETGALTEDVAIWDGFPNFVTLKPGEIVEGDLVIKQNGQYENKSLYAPKVAPAGNFGGSMGRSGAIGKAQEIKAQNIEKAQDNKNLGIKVSSTMRDAVLITTTIINSNSTIPVSTGDIKDMIKEWRRWLWSEFDKEEKDFPPFD